MLGVQERGQPWNSRPRDRGAAGWHLRYLASVGIADAARLGGAMSRYEIRNRPLGLRTYEERKGKQHGRQVHTSAI
jgi:hypothetical protein